MLRFIPRDLEEPEKTPKTTHGKMQVAIGARRGKLFTFKAQMSVCAPNVTNVGWSVTLSHADQLASHRIGSTSHWSFNVGAQSLPSLCDRTLPIFLSTDNTTLGQYPRRSDCNRSAMRRRRRTKIRYRDAACHKPWPRRTQTAYRIFQSLLECEGVLCQVEHVPYVDIHLGGWNYHKTVSKGEDGPLKGPWCSENERYADVFQVRWITNLPANQPTTA